MSLRLATSERLWRLYWHENMYWYGPGGLGSYIAYRARRLPGAVRGDDASRYARVVGHRDKRSGLAVGGARQP